MTPNNTKKYYMNCPKCGKRRHIDESEPGLVSIDCSCGERLYPRSEKINKDFPHNTPVEKFLSNFPTKEQVIIENENTWDFTDRFKTILASAIEKAVKAERERAIKICDRSLRENNGKHDQWNAAVRDVWLKINTPTLGENE